MTEKLLNSTKVSVISIALTVAGMGIVQAQGHNVAQSQSGKEVYVFRHDERPVHLNKYSNTVFVNGLHRVSTARGNMLRNAGKDTVTFFEMSPTGNLYGVIEKGKKKSSAALYNPFVENERKAKFDVGKYGVPASIGFTVDGRNAIVATDTVIYLTDMKKMTPETKIKAFAPKPGKMAVSPSGYFLAVVHGNKCAVYNLENNSLRTVVDAGEKIVDLDFAPDNSDLALLTSDGVVSFYNLRNFELGKMIDELEDAAAISYNLDGKYLAVAGTPGVLTVVNLLSPDDRKEYSSEGGVISDVLIIPDANRNTLMSYTAGNNLEMRRLPGLKPYYNRLINEETDRMMDEWLKMMPGETMDQYRVRVTEESRARQRSKFEYEITTRLAGDLLKSSRLTLGEYDRNNQVLALNFENMPTIFLPVPEAEVTAFSNAGNVVLDDVLFGVLPDDSFEIVYAAVTNNNNNKRYVFDNRERAVLNYLQSGDAISLEVLQQQQMEELRLKELREKVMMEAKSTNVISDHTNIAVNSRVVPDYDAEGNKILNYEVTFTYDVTEGFSDREDFGPGKYHVNESGAASSMLKIVKQAFEGDLAQYLKDCKKMRVKIVGSADATPIVHGLSYDGSYGNYDAEPVYVDGNLTTVSVDSNNLVKENPQLAFLRALGVKDYLEKNVAGYNDMAKDYRYEVNVSKDKGSEFRRITTEFTLVDAFPDN